MQINRISGHDGKHNGVSPIFHFDDGLDEEMAVSRSQVDALIHTCGGAVPTIAEIDVSHSLSHSPLTATHLVPNLNQLIRIDKSIPFLYVGGLVCMQELEDGRRTFHNFEHLIRTMKEIRAKHGAEEVAHFLRNGITDVFHRSCRWSTQQLEPLLLANNNVHTRAT